MSDSRVGRWKTASRHTLSLLALAAFVSNPLPAQVRWDATPFIGMYLPVGPLVDETGPSDVALRKRHIGTLIIGARSGIRVTRHLSLEGTLAYTPSMVAVTDAFTTIDHGAGVVLANIRLPLRIGSPTTTRWAFHIAPGLGVVSRSGGAWAGYSGTTDVAAVFGAGTEIKMMNSGAVLRLEAEDYITWASFDKPVPTRSRIHHDIVWTIGFAFPVVSR